MNDIERKEAWFYEFPKVRDSHVNDYRVSLKCSSLQNAIITSLDKHDILSITLNPFVYFAAPGNHMCDVTITDEDSENESS